MVQMTNRRTRLKGSFLSKKVKCHSPLSQVLWVMPISLPHF
ncbi:MAG: hypothetical protein RI960_1308 [Pseudomonadota bacterium]|jgi:hypothetical protein